MPAYDISEARAHLLQPIERAAAGETVLITLAGKPAARIVAAAETEPRPCKRLGFMAGEIRVPEDFDDLGAEEIEEAFGGSDQ